MINCINLASRYILPARALKRLLTIRYADLRLIIYEKREKKLAVNV